MTWRYLALGCLTVGCAHTIQYELKSSERPRSPTRLPLVVAIQPFALGSDIPSERKASRFGASWESNATSGYGGSAPLDIARQVARHLAHLEVFAEVVAASPAHADLVVEGVVEKLEAYKGNDPFSGPPQFARVVADSFNSHDAEISLEHVLDPNASGERRVLVFASARLHCKLTRTDTNAVIWERDYDGRFNAKVPLDGPNAYFYADQALKVAVDRLTTDVHTAAVLLAAERSTAD